MNSARRCEILWLSMYFSKSVVMVVHVNYHAALKTSFNAYHMQTLVKFKKVRPIIFCTRTSRGWVWCRCGRNRKAFASSCFSHSCLRRTPKAAALFPSTPTRPPNAARCPPACFESSAAEPGRTFCARRSRRMLSRRTRGRVGRPATRLEMRLL